MSTEKNNRPQNMTPEDHAALDAAGAAFNKAQAEGDAPGMEKAHADAEAIRGRYGYTGGQDGSQYNPVPAAQTGTQSTQTSVQPVEQNSAQNTTQNGAQTTAQNTPLAQAQNIAQGVKPVSSKAPDFTGLLDQWLADASKQQTDAIDYATNKGVEELERAEADAQEQFDTQQNQINIDEAKALDNQALYAEARGDKGGIGQAQFGQIQATAMTNRRAVNSARTKLATDTARAIADLRAQGEFQKADAILQLGQTYIGQLIDLQQWGAEYTLNVDQFNAQIQQWLAGFNLDLQQYLTGVEQWNKEFGWSQYQWNSEFNYAKDQDEKNQLAEQGMNLLAMGIRPSASQQQAMGYTDDQIDSYLAQYKLEQEAKVTGGGKTPEAEAKEPNAKTNPYEFLNFHGVTDYNTAEALLSQFYDDAYAAGLAEQYMDMVKNGKFDAPGEPEVITGTPSFSYDPDEGIFTYNGKQYNSLEKLQTAINNSAMSDAQFEALLKKLALYGIPVDALEE